MSKEIEEKSGKISNLQVYLAFDGDLNRKLENKGKTSHRERVTIEEAIEEAQKRKSKSDSQK